MSIGNRIQVTGLILSVKPVNDYDRRLCILTKERGKIGVFAKGARRTGNSLLAGTQACVFGTFTLYEGREAYNLSEAKIDKYFEELRMDMSLAYYAMYFCEVAEFLSRDGNDERNLLKLLYASLLALTKKAMPKELIKAVFEMKAMYINGEGLLISECVKCHKKTEDNFISLSLGGQICEECAKAHREADAMRINPSTNYALWYIASSSIEKLYSFTVNEEVLRELSFISSHYLKIRTSHEFEGDKLLEILENTG